MQRHINLKSSTWIDQFKLPPPPAVVTAKHCLQNWWKGKVIYGQSDRTKTSSGISFEKKDIIFHEKPYVDMALIKLNKPIPIGPNSKPIALPKDPSSTPKLKEKMEVVGWGYACKGSGIKCTSQSRIPEIIQVSEQDHDKVSKIMA